MIRDRVLQLNELVFATVVTLATVFTSNVSAKVAGAKPKIGGVVILFNESKVEQTVFSPAASLVLKFYDETIKLSTGKSFYGYTYSGREWAEANLKNRLIALLKSNDMVDIYLFGHTNRAHYYLLSGIPRDLAAKIRLIYNSGCEDGEEQYLRSWIDQGVQVAIGHQNLSRSYFFATSFLTNWLIHHLSIQESVYYANIALDFNPVQHLYAVLYKNPNEISDTMGDYMGNGNLRFRNSSSH